MSLLRSRSFKVLSAVLLSHCMTSTVLADEFVGLVHPVKELSLSIGQGGVVAAVRVQPGQKVKAREVLLVLDDRMQALEVNRRKVVLDDRSELQSTADRVRVLKQMYETAKQVHDMTGSVSRDELARLEVEYSTARARIDQLEAQEKREAVEYQSALQELSMRQLLAPVSGIITQVTPKVGEWAKPGDAMMELVDASVCYLKLNVPLKFAQGLREGMSIPISIEHRKNAAPVKGAVSYVAAVADRASGLVEVRITFVNTDQSVRPGVKGVVRLRADGAYAAM